MHDETKIQILFRKYIDKTINSEELEQLFNILNSAEGQEDFDRLLQAYFQKGLIDDKQLDLRSRIVQDNAWLKIRETVNKKKENNFNFSLLFKVAAVALIFIISASIYFFQSQPAYKSNITVYHQDIQPGTNRATLTLANGAKYELKGEKQGIVVRGKSILYADGDVLTRTQVAQYLSLATPRGGQFKVTLGDGTKVWLNAASRLSYPESFTGNERKVTLEGEAFFEVAHDKQHPFIVSTQGQQIKVLGTSFNVNAYLNEHKTVTTLSTGRIQLSSDDISSKMQLQPGDQAVFDNLSFKARKVNPDIYNAWKDGEFRFNATPLIEALRQIERWYDLDIDYTGIPDDIQIHASVSRNKQLSSVIHALEKVTDLKFETKGRRVRLVK